MENWVKREIQNKKKIHKNIILFFPILYFTFLKKYKKAHTHYRPTERTKDNKSKTWKMIFHVYNTLKSAYDMGIMLVEFNIPTDTKYEMKLTAFPTFKYCNVYTYQPICMVYSWKFIKLLLPSYQQLCGLNKYRCIIRILTRETYDSENGFEIYFSCGKKKCSWKSKCPYKKCLI